MTNTTRLIDELPQKGSPLWKNAKRIHNRKMHQARNTPCNACLAEACQEHDERLAEIAYGDYGDD